MNREDSVEADAIRSVAARPAARLAAAALLSLLPACEFHFPGSDAATVGTKGLWVANGTDVVEFAPRQFVNGTTAAVPQRTIRSKVFGAPQGVSFDRDGNLWVTDPTGLVNGSPAPALFEFSAAQLAALGSQAAPDPIATVTSSGLKLPQQSVFDAAGNQWVTDHDGDAVLVFAASDLAQSGTNTVDPAIRITSAQFNGPLGIAFDAAGSLWVANNGGVPGSGGTLSSTGTTIVAFAATKLPALEAGHSASVSLNANVTLADDGQSSIQAPWALAFDSSGNLWSGNSTTPGTLVEFARTDLSSSGSPRPAVLLSSRTVGGDQSLDAPNGLCFDDVGNLAAVDSAGAFAIAFYGKKQLSTGNPVPDTFIVGSATTLDQPAGCQFGPAIT